jgi:hypothetical protein
MCRLHVPQYVSVPWLIAQLAAAGSMESSIFYALLLELVVHCIY